MKEDTEESTEEDTEVVQILKTGEAGDIASLADTDLQDLPVAATAVRDKS